MNDDQVNDQVNDQINEQADEKIEWAPPIIVRRKSNTQVILKSYCNITDHKLYFDNNNKQRIFICEFFNF